MKSLTKLINRKYIVSILLVIMSLFHLYTGGFKMFPANWQRGIHLSFLLGIIFLLKPLSKKEAVEKSRLLSYMDIGLSIMGFIVPLYVAYTLDKVTMALGYVEPQAYLWGFVLIVLILEATRRAAGKGLVIVVLVFFLYSYFGQYIPGFLSHRPISTKILIDNLALSTRGIFGLVLRVSASYIFLFVLFGSVMQYTKLTDFIWKIAKKAAKKIPGGAAQVAVFSSGLMGMISGSAVGNVATTGVFTIPLMKRSGFKDYFAAAVEAAASTGGQIMPPIMGASAFVMAEYLGIPYVHIAIAAAIPAIFYFLSIAFMVYNRALKLDIRSIEAVTDEDEENISTIIAQGWHVLIPVVLIVAMLIKGFTPVYSAFYGIVSALIVSNLRKNTRMKPKDFYYMLEKGARNALTVGICCAAIGMVIGITSLTSLGIVFSSYLVDIAHSNLFLLLIVGMIASIILGLGLPTVAVYIVGATIIAPAFYDLIEYPLAIHLFIFYYGVIGAVTPPVALASLTASGIAQSDFQKTGWTGMKIAIVGFIVPLIMVYYPDVLIIYSDSVLNIIKVILMIVLSILGLTGLMEGYLFHKLKLYERAILGTCTVLVLIKYPYLQLAGAIIILLITLKYIFKNYKQEKNINTVSS